ncbi:hypothetical protein [Neptunicella sp. SCSIO 80796]|uniref:hypothetical protein n=1 Tax=Neptunicella plasticusilytica TaxID=3117012 RepID=UPI003A4DA9EA
MSILIVTMILSACGEAPVLPSQKFKQKVLGLIAEIEQQSFPALQGISLSLQGIDSSSIFLATDIEVPALLIGQRHYVLYLNPKLEQQNIGDTALKAILVHELTHFNDYQKMDVFELGRFYYAILTDPMFEAEYERATDFQTLKLGYAQGLAEFRQWLYPQLSEAELKIKQRNYYTPAEIKQWSEESAQLL